MASAEYVFPQVSELWGLHAGADIFVCGYGTSLFDFDWQRLAGRVVIALNDTIQSFPDATYHLYSDKKLCEHYWHVPYGDATLICVQPESIGYFRAAMDWRHLPKVRKFIRVDDASIQSIRRFTDELWVRRTVAAAGIMMAWKLGAARVYLLGIDAYRQPDTSYYADRRCHKEKSAIVYTTERGLVVEERHQEWATDMLTVRHYLETQRDQYRETIPEVWNLSTQSTVTAWPKKDMEEVLGA